MKSKVDMREHRKTHHIFYPLAVLQGEVKQGQSEHFIKLYKNKHYQGVKTYKLLFFDYYD